ncbi:MAG: NADH-quinone oxidoreductase subunit A [Cyanobacteria bacterium REEB67]|nr:NADH-quinone oxidoreductase subunit A [Cyanobacteria bacterium REEB67]
MDQSSLQLAQIIIFVVLAFALPALGMILLAWVLQLALGYHRPNSLKNQPYECGMRPLQEALVQFDIRYYLYALLFILFDIEVIFIIPWLMATDSLPRLIVGDAKLAELIASSNMMEILRLRMIGPVEMTMFVAILAVGLIYAWKKGAMEWE